MDELPGDIDSAIRLVSEQHFALYQLRPDHELLRYVRLTEAGFEYVPETRLSFEQRFAEGDDPLKALTNFYRALKTAHHHIDETRASKRIPPPGVTRRVEDIVFDEMKEQKTQ